MTDLQDDCPSLGENPLMKETSMVDLLGMELKQHSKFYKYRACLYYFHADFLNHFRERHSIVSLGLYCIYFVSYGKRKVTPCFCCIHHYEQPTSSSIGIGCNL